MDRPVGIPLKHVELCYAEISHISVVVVADVISIHVKFDLFKNLDPVADAASLWLRSSSIRLLFCHLRRMICWRTEQIRSAIKKSYLGVILTSRIPVATEHRLVLQTPTSHTPTHPPTHTFVRAPYRIFLAPTDLTGTGA